MTQLWACRSCSVVAAPSDCMSPEICPNCGQKDGFNNLGRAGR